MNEFHYFPSAVYREEKPEWVDHVLKNVERYYKQQKDINEEPNVVPKKEEENIKLTEEVSLIKDLMKKIL